MQVAGCASKGSINSTNQNFQAALSNEIAIGQQIHQQIISKMVVNSDSQLNKYVTSIGKNLASYSKRKELPYRFIILDDERIYATSAPGGFVYVTTGCIRYLSNESELAGVLAQEIGMLERKESRISKSRIAMEKLLTGSAMVAPFFGNIGALALLGAFGIYSMTGSGDPHSQKVLARADRAALKLMNQANYDPQGLIDLERKILNANSKDLMYLYDYQQARNVTQARLNKLEREFSKLNLEGKVFDSNRPRFISMTQSLQTSVSA